VQSADDALMPILRKLDTFRGESRFTTWAAKFAILEAATKARRRAWQHREVTLAPDDWQLHVAADEPQTDGEHAELLNVIGPRSGSR
jgi:RNA polymerase sigma-70 factor (ECF subfamily)